MVRSRRSISKEDASSLLADSGISLSSPPATVAPLKVKPATIKNGKNVSTKLKTDLDLTDSSHHYKSDLDADVNDDDDDDKDFEVDNVDCSDDDDDDGDDDDDDDEDEDVNFDINLENKTIKSTTTTKAATAAAAAASTTPTTSKASSKVKLSSTEKKRKQDSLAKKARKAYICLVCNKEFGGKSDLQRHMLIHSNERPHKCEQCNKTYRQAVNLKHHIISTHKAEKQFQCELCPKAFALKERLRLHMRLHSGDKPYVCPACEKRFARGGQLQQHKVTHHADSALKQFHCKVCSSSFSTAANLRAHQERHEQGPEHFCEICKEHFPNDVMLRVHINRVHYKLKQFDCEICKETIDEDDFARHMKTHAQVKAHICQLCQAYFTQKSQYNVHMRMHTGERPYQCRICWQTFAHSSVLKLHIRKHTGEKPFQCLLCKEDEVSFSQLAHLKTHMNKIHKQSNPYMCTGCGEFFKIKAELQNHMEKCRRCDVDNNAINAQQQEQQILSNLRFNIALLLKKISSEQTLQQLGYEKRLIDNVVVASLKLADRKAYDDHKLSAIERMRLNVEEFLNWIVPSKVMEGFQHEALSVESILDKIVTMYMKQK